MSEETVKVEATGGSSPTVAATPLSAEMMGLSPKQQLALQALMAGKNFTRAAFAGGVSRQTLHKWRCQEPRFASALRTWRMNALETAQTVLLESVEDAAQTVAEAVSSGDAYIAMEVLRNLNVLSSAREMAAERQALPAPV